jgi:tripartite ATP-independent transporter DctM subunit
MMPVIILGGIYGGIMTPTEAAGIAVVYAIPIAIYFYKGLTWRTLATTIQSSGVTIGVVMVMIFMVLIVSDNLIAQGAPALAKQMVYSVSENPIIILLMINVVMILIGMLMDDISGLLLATPILLPIAMNSYGISPFQFGVVISINLALGLLTPPVGVGLYIAASMSDVKPTAIFRSLWPFLLAVVLVLLVLCYFPALNTTDTSCLAFP